MRGPLLESIKDQVVKDIYNSGLGWNDITKSLQIDLWPEVCKRIYLAEIHNQAIDAVLNEFSEQITPAEWYIKIQNLKK